MANQDRIARIRVELPIGFDRQPVVRQRVPAGKVQGLVKIHELRTDDANRAAVGIGDGCRDGSVREFGRSGHTDLFSGIYEAPASRSSKSAPIHGRILSPSRHRDFAHLQKADCTAHLRPSGLHVQEV